MNKKTKLLPLSILVLSLFLSACVGLIPLEEEPVAGDFGPKTSLQEQQIATFETVWNHLQENYIYLETADVNWDALHDEYLQRLQAGLTPEEFSALMEELAAELPEGSMGYQSRTERIEADVADTSSYEGIGAFVGFSEEPEPHIVLLDVIEGSPAEQAGLKAHDRIFEIDGSPILLEEGLTAVDRVRGPAGSSVTLRIQSPGEPVRSVEVQRGKLNTVGRLEAYNLTGTNYGYLLFPPVGYDTLDEDVVKSMQAFTTNQTLDGLILDLRIASSTRGWPLEAMYTMFYDGPMGDFYTRNDKQSVQVEGQDVFGSQEVPLVVLVGRNTSGTPEILAASLQAHERATVVGEPTPGSIEGATSYYLPDGSDLFIQTTSFMLPSGTEIGTQGVVPDVPVEAGWDDILPNQDPVLDQAIEILDELQ
ncbi:MAG TPA: S41 family peptidase [Anaerolineales bacterium]|nr:S41 family peptidase [Anaerolineales bacterium]